MSTALCALSAWTITAARSTSSRACACWSKRRRAVARRSTTWSSRVLRAWARPRWPPLSPTSWALRSRPRVALPSRARATWRPSLLTCSRAMCCLSTRSTASTVRSRRSCTPRWRTLPSISWLARVRRRARFAWISPSLRWWRQRPAQACWPARCATALAFHIAWITTRSRSSRRLWRARRLSWAWRSTIPVHSRSARVRAARHVLPTVCSSACAITHRCAATAPSSSISVARRSSSSRSTSSVWTGWIFAFWRRSPRRSPVAPWDLRPLPARWARTQARSRMSMSPICCSADWWFVRRRAVRQPSAPLSTWGLNLPF
jgi:ruvB: Holliday junction DNA helicase RuvB